MNKNDLRDIKLFIGPMTSRVVDSVISFCEDQNIKLGLIPSRRQVDFDCGYVNNWKTSTFSNYVKDRTNKVILERDHGGPNQGQDLDNGFASFFQDCIHLDIIHIDVWKKYPDFNEGLLKTIEYINYCYFNNKEVLFEIGTEEAIRKFNRFELEYLLHKLKLSLLPEVFDRIAYLVIQSGTSLKENVNTGTYDREKLKSMVEIADRYDILSKEHNSDFVDLSELHDRYDNGLSAINIAPEFGRIETMAILDIIGYHGEIFEKFYKICFDSDKWKKWVTESFVPENNKLDLIKITGHYVISNSETKKIIDKFKKQIDDTVKREVYKKISQILRIS